MARSFDNLRGGSRARLARFRRKLSEFQSRDYLSPETRAGATWRSMRHGKFSDPYPAACHGWNTEHGRRVPIVSAFSFDALPVRSVTFADDVEGTRIDHKGWFADAEGTGDRGTIRGIVTALPHGRYIAGYHWSDNGESVLFVGDVFTGEDAREDAARAADSHAQRYAELCRDDDERFQRMAELEGLCESKESDIREAWDDYRAAWAAYLANPRHASAARKAREWVREIVGDLRAFRRELAEARAEYEGA